MLEFSRMFLPITYLFSLIALSSQNDCIDGEIYLTKYSPFDLTNISVVTAPENGTLKPVGDKWCGFVIREKLRSHCSTTWSIEYSSMNVTGHRGTHCVFYDLIIMCACDFYACNSVTGTLYQALVDSLDMRNTRTIAHPTNPNEYMLEGIERENLIDKCLMRVMETIYGGVIATRMTLNRLNWIEAYPKFFPNATIVNQTIEAGLSKYPPSTIPPTTLPPSTLATTETTPKVEAAALKQDAPSAKNKSDSSSSMSGLTYGLIAVICVSLLVNAGLIGFILFKMNDAKPKADDTKKVENSKSIAESGSQMSKV